VTVATVVATSGVTTRAHRNTTLGVNSSERRAQGYGRAPAGIPGPPAQWVP
jgi:hypothetical protein